jgi:hypothetical protein
LCFIGILATVVSVAVAFIGVWGGKWGKKKNIL